MKTAFLITFVMAMIFTIITGLVKPEIFITKYQELRAPIDQYFLDKELTVWRNTKEQEKAMWGLKIRLPEYCNAPNSAIEVLECRNEFNNYMQQFEVVWANKVRSGWKPDGIR